MSQSVIISRKLAPSENFYRCRTQNGFYRSFAVAAKYNRSLLDLPVLFKAVRKTLLDYHIFACNLYKNVEKGYCEFQPISQITLKDLVTTTDDYALDSGESVERFMSMMCLNDHFELYQDKPLLRLFISQGCFLGVSFEHTIADGVVGGMFHEIFLKNLSLCDSHNYAETYNDLYGIPPEEISWESIVFNFVNDERFMRNSLPPFPEMFMEDSSLDHTHNDPNHYSKKVPDEYPQKWPGRFPASMGCSRAMRLVKLSPEELKSVLVKCKQMGVTFTSYFAIIQALTLNGLFGDKHHISLLNSVSMRRFIRADLVEKEYQKIVTDPEYKILGNFAHMGLPELLPPVKTFSWELARKANSNLLETSQNRRLLHTIHPFISSAHGIDKNENLFTASLGKPKADSVKVSNLGFINFPIYSESEHDWTIDDIYFGQDMAPAAGEFMLSLVSCPRGGLSIMVSYFDEKYNAGEEEFLNDFPNQLKCNLIHYADVRS